MLCDTSPLVALIRRNERQHLACRKVISSLRQPLITTWPCFTEASYLLSDRGGYPPLETLWSYFNAGTLQFYHLTEIDCQRMQVLLKRYQDLPMDLADASLVAAAESLNQKTIFTLDGDFYVYRFRDKEPFQVIPE